MTTWLYNIKLTQVISDTSKRFDMTNPSGRVPRRVKDEMIAEINKAEPLKHFSKKINKCKTVAELNYLLQDIYDAADKSKVWCGGMP